MDALELGEEMCWPMLKLLFSYQRSSFWTFSIFIRPNLTREAFSLLMFESWKSETQNYLFHLVFWPFFHSVECLYRLEEGNFKSIFTEMWCGHFVAEINLGNLRFFVCFSVPRGDVCPPTTRKLFHVYLILCARSSDSTLRIRNTLLILPFSVYKLTALSWKVNTWIMFCAFISYHYTKRHESQHRLGNIQKAIVISMPGFRLEARRLFIPMRKQYHCFNFSIIITNSSNLLHFSMKLSRIILLDSSYFVK